MPVYPAYPKDLDRFIFADSPPATRRDGSPIQIGDLVISSKGSFFYDGLQWLGEPLTITSARGATSTSTGVLALTTSPVLPSQPFFLASGEISISSPPNPVGENYWVGQLGIFSQLAGGGGLLGQPVNLTGLPPLKITFPIGVVLGSAPSHRLQAVQLTRINSAPSITYAVSYTYHLIL